MKLIVRHFTDTGHILPDTKYLISKGCSRFHGHSYAFIVSFESDTLKGGMAVDFKAIKQLIDEIDHRSLVFRGTHEKLLQFLELENPDQVIEFPYIPSAENISIYIAEKIHATYPHLYNIQVKVCEGYKGLERANWTIHNIK